MTPYKGHMNNLVTSFPFQKGTINKRESYEPHGSKTHYTISNNSYTDNSHDNENMKKLRIHR